MTIDNTAVPSPADNISHTTTKASGAVSTRAGGDPATAIEATGVVKTFGSTRALDGLDLVSGRVRSMASSGRTGPVSPPRSAFCSV